LTADIELVKRLVVEAGKSALARTGDIFREYKADESLVTAIDRDTENFLYEGLNSAYPDYAFLGEEFGWRGPENAPLWACDPIDGTTNFVYGIPLWAVSVGLLVDGVPVLGAVYLPRLDELFWAERGEGAFCNGARLQAEDREVLHMEDTLCLTSNSAKTLNTEAIAGRVRSLGSIATELVYTARGNLCGTVGLHEGIVDMAASFCICTEAGCRVQYLGGNDLSVPDLIQSRHTSRHFIVAPPNLMAYLQQILHIR
jgi:fructose-1,6-bisphosphatase/inositol monophosphatase family enzyme